MKQELIDNNIKLITEIGDELELEYSVGWEMFYLKIGDKKIELSLDDFERLVDCYKVMKKYHDKKI